MANQVRAAAAATVLVAMIGACARPQKPDLGGVRACFQVYKEASLRGDGRAAAGAVSSVIFDLFESLRDVAMIGDRETVDGLPIFRKLLVVLFRHDLPDDKLEAMSGDELFQLAFERGWIGDATWLAGADLGEIIAEGDTAVATITEEGAPTEDHIQFIREEGIWKLDLAVTLSAADRFEKSQMNTLGWPENRYLFDRVARITGRPVSDTILQRH